MRSTAHGSLATVLLLVPILAIPFLAVFGVPNFVPVVKSPTDPAEVAGAGLEDAPAFSPAPAWGEQDFPTESPAVRQPSEHAWANDPGVVLEPLPPRDPIAVAVAPGVRTAAAWDAGAGTTDMPHPDAYRRPANATPGGAVAAVHQSASGSVTWKTAVERLNKLEIRNFRLEPGQQAGQFLFICSYTPQHSPRLSYRFEAEADEPLRAVEKVLTQIDSWIASR